MRLQSARVTGGAGGCPRIPRQRIRLPAGRATPPSAFVWADPPLGYGVSVEHEERQEEREQEIKGDADELERQGDELEERGDELEKRVERVREEFEDRKRSGDLPGGESP